MIVGGPSSWPCGGISNMAVIWPNAGCDYPLAGIFGISRPHFRERRCTISDLFLNNYELFSIAKVRLRRCLVGMN